MFTQAFEGENGETADKSLCKEIIPENFPTVRKH